MQGVFFLGIVLFALERHSAESSSVAFSVFNKLEDNTCRDEDNAFKKLKVPTIMICCSICASDVDCKGFTYFPKSMRCDGCKQTYSTDGQQKATGGTIYVRSEVMKKAYRSVGCYAMPCLSGKKGGGGCSFRRGGNIVGATVELCLETCDGWISNVRSVAIKEDECYCDMEYKTYSSGTCDIQCEGNAQQICGGETAVSVYTKEA